MIEKDLFDDIVGQLESCDYISDLRVMIERNNVTDFFNVLNTLERNDYSLNQWIELYRYLFDKGQKFQSVDEVFESILNNLK